MCIHIYIYIYIYSHIYLILINEDLNLYKIFRKSFTLFIAFLSESSFVRSLVALKTLHRNINSN